MLDRQYSSVKKVLWVILIANFLVAAVKIGVGVACGSQSILADGIHSVSDGSSNIVGLIGIWLASRPKDAKHPYGHDKYEIIASLFIGIMLAVMSVRIVSRAVTSFRNPVPLSIDYIEVGLILLTIIVNIIVAGTEYRRGKKLGSTILVTDSLHTRGDIMISCTVLIGLIGIKLGIPVWIDGVMSVLVGAAVMISAWKIIRNCVDVLVDSTSVNCEEVKALLMSTPGIRDVHKVRSRGNPSHAFIELHAVVSPEGNIEAMHALSHRLESALKERFGPETEVSIHLEPDDGLHDGKPV